MDTALLRLIMYLRGQRTWRPEPMAYERRGGGTPGPLSLQNRQEIVRKALGDGTTQITGRRII